MMARPGVPSQLCSYTHTQKKDRKRRRRKIVLRPREIIDLARSPLSCAQREGVCRYHNILIESRSLLCPAQNIIKLLLLKNGPRKKTKQKQSNEKKKKMNILLFVVCLFSLRRKSPVPSITPTASAPSVHAACVSTIRREEEKLNQKIMFEK